MVGVELVRDRQTKERATTERDAVVNAAFGRGLLLLGAGKNSIRFSPPLVLTREQADIAVRIFDDALTEVKARVVMRRPLFCCLYGRMSQERIALGKTGEDLACVDSNAWGTQSLPA